MGKEANRVYGFSGLKYYSLLKSSKLKCEVHHVSFVDQSFLNLIILVFTGEPTDTGLSLGI